MDKDGLVIAVGVGISDAAQEVKKWCCVEWDAKIRPGDVVELVDLAYFI